MANGVVTAGDVRQGVKAKHGEIALVRSVPPRVAYRRAPDGMALIVDPSPKKEITRSLGTDELSDAEYAAIGGGPIHRAVNVLRTQAGALATDPQGSSQTHAPTQGASGRLSPLGAVGNSTRAAGDQLKSALGALPFPSTTTPGGGG